MQSGLHVVDWGSPLGGGGLLSLCLAASPYLLTSTLRSEVVHDLGAVVVQCPLKRGVAILREERTRKGEREWERGSEREGVRERGERGRERVQGQGEGQWESGTQK